VIKELVKISTIITLAFSVITASADGHEEDAPFPTFGIEVFSCNYNEGKDLNDLLQASKKWRDWATKTMEHPYSAWLFTPMFYDKAPSHDVYWVGTSDSMITLGAVQDKWLKAGGKYQAAFSKIISCDSHKMYQGETLRFTLDSTDSGNAQFFGCNFKEGATPEKFIAGTKGFRAFVDTLELKEGIWRWWPSVGHFDAPEWNYLEVVGSASLQERFANKAKYDAQNGDSVWWQNNSEIIECSNVADANYIQIK
jgi:hypothetical protein